MTGQLFPGDLIARAQVISGLRQLADYLDHHQDLPVPPFGWTVRVFPLLADKARDRAEVDRIAEILGVAVADQTGDGGHYIAARSFGRIIYEAVHIPARCHDAQPGRVTP